MHARNIKDLSIALEALTRVQSVEDEFEAVQALLNEEISSMHKEQNPLKKVRDDADDDIPF